MNTAVFRLYYMNYFLKLYFLIVDRYNANFYISICTTPKPTKIDHEKCCSDKIIAGENTKINKPILFQLDKENRKTNLNSVSN